MNISDLQKHMLNAKYNCLPNKYNKVIITHTQNATQFNEAYSSVILQYHTDLHCMDIFLALENNLMFLETVRIFCTIRIKSSNRYQSFKSVLTMQFSSAL